MKEEDREKSQSLPVNSNTYNFFKEVFINAGELSRESVEQITQSDSIMNIYFSIVLLY